MIEGWVGYRDGMNAVVERKIYCPYWELNPGLATILGEMKPLYSIKNQRRRGKNLGQGHHTNKHKILHCFTEISVYHT
jgi:hypothetical protein